MRHPVRTVSTSICRRARRTLMQDEVSSADSVTNGRPIHNRNPEAGNPRQCWLWLGERSRAQQRKTAAERREVLRNGVVWRCSAHEATGRNRANTGAQGKKIPTDEGWALGIGGQGRNRTTDTRIFSPLLYRLSYLAAEDRHYSGGKEKVNHPWRGGARPAGRGFVPAGGSARGRACPGRGGWVRG